MRKSYYGEKFGEWTVLDKRCLLVSDKANCRCSCGANCDVLVKSLKSGQSKMCRNCVNKKSGNERLKCYYGCSFNDWTVIDNRRVPNKEKVKVVCKCGFEDYVNLSNLKYGQSKSCTNCGLKRTAKSRTKDLTGMVFGDLKVIKMEDKRANNRIVYKCKCSCGNYLIVSGAHLVSGHTISCGCAKSKAEFKLKCILDSNSIEYIYQKRFSDCKNIKELSFDFYIKDLNILIEAQGKQHYESVSFFGGEDTFLSQVKRDRIKKEYCETHNIKLICIGYWDFDRIEQVLIENNIIKGGAK